MDSWCVAYKCRNPKNKNPNLTFFSLPRNRKNYQNMEKYFQESCFNKCVNLRRRLMNNKILIYV